MTGSGTAQDPYILTTWQELLNASGVCEWYGGDLDFNDIQPTGFTECVVISATSINFRGATFKNFYSRATGTAPCSGGIRFSCNISNLRFINSAFVNVRSPQIGVIDEHSSVSATSCVFDGEIISTNRDIVIVGSSSNSSYYYSTSYNKCSFNFKTKSAHRVWFASAIAAFYDCDIYTDIEQDGNEFSDIYSNGTSEYNSRFSNCRLRGRFINTGGDYVKVGDTNSRHAFNYFAFDEGTYLLLSSSSKSVYNSEKITAYEGTTNVVGCTSAQLSSISYLRSDAVGWEINENARFNETITFTESLWHNVSDYEVDTTSTAYDEFTKATITLPSTSDRYQFFFRGYNSGGVAVYGSDWQTSGKTVSIPLNANIATWVLRGRYYSSPDWFHVEPSEFANTTCTLSWGRWSINSNGELYNIYSPTSTKLGAFANAVSLTQISIPRSCKKIGRFAFTNTQLSSVTIASDCTYYDTSFPEGCVVNFYPD